MRIGEDMPGLVVEVRGESGPGAGPECDHPVVPAIDAEVMPMKLEAVSDLARVGWPGLLMLRHG
ncbi:hypothetical protein Aros01_02582 [Streptosporangium roseum]|uniref:Uncharacterized protein n=1 Tax=Streptosporangium roseum (strain ATCC 12428 / DSM 43021 / JCM 3005 / KCTC 9067 / NCIMB 10171 / NRRL 2505 / NI 9100) TaxID=479432 RepID=D2AXF6_STRRD|nr:hypothetical protein Sros_0080 [Streptosporangium roseum DSM 43021]